MNDIMWQVHRLTDKSQILSFLERDRWYAAYAIGDLEPSFFDLCQWYGAENDGDLRALAMLFSGLEPPVLFLMGEVPGLSMILGSALRPRRVYVTCRQSHLPAVRAFYNLSKAETMLRMILQPADFRAVPGEVTRLSPAYTKELERLYSMAEGNAFKPYQVAQGVFYGIERKGRLIATAGTHVVSPNYGVAAVGNVFTDPNHRRRGYATICTSAVVEELLSRRLDVVLNVSTANATAIHVYERLGFRPYCRFIEVVGVRRGSRQPTPGESTM
ncbi:MAG: GNAT family N-acetyltransferase [Anaerolineae bacterium]|nr:GNAT family N-acetyltransferase [Anaerolineae bacterium]